MSHDQRLDSSLDIVLYEEGPVSTAGLPSATDTYFHNGLLNLEEVDQSFCGEVYLLGEVDPGNDVPETDEAGNLVAIQTTHACPGGMYI